MQRILLILQWNYFVQHSALETRCQDHRPTDSDKSTDNRFTMPQNCLLPGAIMFSVTTPVYTNEEILKVQ